MHMIHHPVNQQRLTTQIAHDAAHVREQVRLQVRGDLRQAVLFAEDHMDDQVGEGVSHTSVTPPGFLFIWPRTHSLHCGLKSVAPPGLGLVTDSPTVQTVGENLSPRLSWRSTTPRPLAAPSGGGGFGR